MAHRHWLSGRIRLHDKLMVHHNKRALQSHKEVLGKKVEKAKWPEGYTPNKEELTRKPAPVMPVLYNRPAVDNSPSTYPVEIQKDGYLFIDIAATPVTVSGIRIKFVRTEGRTRRTVGLQIEKR